MNMAEVNVNSTFNYSRETSTQAFKHDVRFLFVKGSDIPILMFVNLLECIGIFGNLHAFFIYLFMFRSSIHRTFILYLALVDLLTCVSEIPYYTIWYLNEFSSQGLCKFLIFIHTMPSGSSLMVLCFIAVDRYRRVCRPLRAQFSMTQVILVLSFITVYMTSLYGFGASLHNLKIAYTQDIPPKSVGGRCFITDVEHFSVYVYTIMLFMNNFLCLIVSSVVYFLICKGLVKRRRILKEMAVKRREEHGNNEGIQTDSWQSKWYLADITRTHDDILNSNSLNTGQNDKKVMQMMSPARNEVGQKTDTFNKAINRTLMFGIATLVSYFGVFCFTAVSATRGLIHTKILLSLDESVIALIDVLSRLYILNHVVNPYVYCLLDKKFRSHLKGAYKKLLNKFP